MLQLLRRSCALALVLALAGSEAGRADTATAQAAIDPAGIYRIDGDTGSESYRYEGRLEIARQGPSTYALAWQLDRGDKYLGVGLLEGNVLGAVYWSGALRDLGIVIYRIDGGTLTGTWAPANHPIGIGGRETLKGPPGLDGRYAITLGQEPNEGSRYTGEVEIKRTRDTYELRWFLPGPAFVGRGIKVGDLLVVGYGPEAPGVVAYCMTEQGGDGVWSYGEKRSVGREVIARAGANPAAIAAECSGEGI